VWAVPDRGLTVSAAQQTDLSDGARDLDVELLDELPAVAPLIAKATLRARGRPGSLGGLPGRRVLTTGVHVRADRLAGYTHLCGMSLRNQVPATYLHVLTFPLQVHLMAARDFPYAMAGMVHVANTMTLHRPVEIGETLTLSSSAADVRAHHRGVTVDLLGRAEVGAETVWEGTSTYLVRGAEAPSATQGSSPGAPSSDLSPGDRSDDDPPQDEAADEGAAPGSPSLSSWARWRLPADLGRRYAAVSGDVNPIHLNPLAAKAFGFPRTIAHGMWTHARVLGALQGRLQDRHTVTVDFRKPVLLPSTVDFSASRGDHGWRFGVTGKDGERVHLTGTVEAPRAGIISRAEDDFTHEGRVV